MTQIGTPNAIAPSGSRAALRARLLATTRIVTLAVVATTLAACSSSNINSKFASQTADLSGAEASGTDSLLALADRLAAEGNHNGAIPLYRQSIRKHRGAHEPRLGLGKSLMAIGQYGEAALVLERAHDDEEEDPEILEALATTYLALGDAELAALNFEEAERFGGSSSALYSGYGVSQDLLGRHDAAISAFEEGLSRNGNSPELLNNLGLSEALSGNSEEGVRILEELVVSDTGSAEARQNLALAYVLAGDPERAYNMASIDLDPERARDAVANFQVISRMSPSDRLRAMLYGAVEPREDLQYPANPVFGEDDTTKLAAAERVVLQPEPEPEPVMEPEPMPEPEPEPAPETPDLPPLIDPHGWSVQIAAYRRAEDVMPGWEELKERYSDIIGHLEPRRSEVDFGNRDEEPSGFFYRLNAGPLSGLEEGLSICEAIRARSGGGEEDCWVRPPEPSEGTLPPEDE